MKIGDVLSDVFGLSGQLMLEALVEGKASSFDIAQLWRVGTPARRSTSCQRRWKATKCAPRTAR